MVIKFLSVVERPPALARLNDLMTVVLLFSVLVKLLFQRYGTQIYKANVFQSYGTLTHDALEYNWKYNNIFLFGSNNR